MTRRVGEVVLGLREVQPEGLLCRLQLIGSQKFLDQRETPFADLLEGCVRHPHRAALYASQKLSSAYVRRARSPQFGDHARGPGAPPRSMGGSHSATAVLGRDSG